MRAGALAVAAVLVLAFAASARALPGDPQPASLTPAVVDRRARRRRLPRRAPQLVRVTVSGRGRRVKVVRAEVPTFCGTSPNTTTVALPPISIAPDGRFAFEGTYEGTSVRLVGRLRRRALSGTRLGVATGRCSGSIALQARRAGR